MHKSVRLENVFLLSYRGDCLFAGSVLTNLGGATDVAHMHDTAAFTACTFMNNSLAPDSAILFAQDMGAVRLQVLLPCCTFVSYQLVVYDLLGMSC